MQKKHWKFFLNQKFKLLANFTKSTIFTRGDDDRWEFSVFTSDAVIGDDALRKHPNVIA